MIKIHQPYIKRKVRMTFAFASIGVLLLALGIIIASPTTHPTSHVYAAGDSRTIHDISNMQEMTQQICSNTDEGDTETLTDSRDGKYYIIIKQTKDKNCWMQQNLQLNLTSGTAIEGSKADGTAYSWTPTATTQAYSTSGTWTSDSSAVMSRAGSGTNGNYYTWCAATAGTCTSATSNGAVASASICPKGWKLPTGNTNGELYNLTNGLNKSSITASPYLFPVAGCVAINGSLNNVGFNGRYWSSTAYSSTAAYGLYFDSSLFRPGTRDDGRYFGFSVRCVAPGGLEKIEKPTWSESKDGNVTVTMPSIISIDATSGMDETADSTEIAEGTATATISSNTNYNITIHSTQPALKDPTVTTAEISPVSATNPVQPGNNSWGFWDGTGDSNNKSYALPITTTPQNLYNSKETITNTDGNPATKHTYYVGISISPTLPSGTYATDVIITASDK